MGTFPDVAVKDFETNNALVVKGFDLGGTKSGLAHVLVDSSGNIAILKVSDAIGAAAPGLVLLAKQTSSPADFADANNDGEPLQIKGGHLWTAPPIPAKLSANFNRPGDTSQYGANDMISDNTVAGSSTKMSFSSIPRSCGTIRRVKVRKSSEGVATPTIRVWLWDADFTIAAGDNAAFAAPLANSIGFVDVAVTNAGNDDAVGWASADIPFVAGTLYCMLQTLSVFTPGSAETFTVELLVYPG